ASDALSSVAYATEEILLVLVLAGTVALSYSLPIAIAIAILIAIVVSSYRQTIRAYPQGGGAYIVSKDNLGTNAGLVAGAALLILGVHSPHRRRACLRRRARVQAAGGAERAHPADVARRDLDHPLPGHHRSRLRLRPRPARRRDGRVPARPPRLWRRGLLLRDPGRHDADLAVGREHLVRRLPTPQLLPGARPLHPAAVRDAGRPARLLQRHRDPRRRGHGAAHRVPRPHARADPALPRPPAPVVHAVTTAHGAAP